MDTSGDHFHDADPNQGGVSLPLFLIACKGLCLCYCQIPNEFVARQFVTSNGRAVYGVYACYAAALEPFAQELAKDFLTGWEQLMKYDTLSARAFFVQVMQYPLDVIQWMEDRMSAGTGLFNKGFAEVRPAFMPSLTTTNTSPGRSRLSLLLPCTSARVQGRRR